MTAMTLTLVRGSGGSVSPHLERKEFGSGSLGLGDSHSGGLIFKAAAGALSCDEAYALGTNHPTFLASLTRR